ncbi:hypothetical protein D3C84_1270740 [compost metagenome]
MATELQVLVAAQYAWQQARFRKDLETVADAENELALLGCFDHFVHNRSKTRDGAAAQVVAVGEAPWH